jgi:hypothetical protein
MESRVSNAAVDAFSVLREEKTSSRSTSHEATPVAFLLASHSFLSSGKDHSAVATPCMLHSLKKKLITSEASLLFRYISRCMFALQQSLICLIIACPNTTEIVFSICAT